LVPKRGSGRQFPEPAGLRTGESAFNVCVRPDYENVSMADDVFTIVGLALNDAERPPSLQWGPERGHGAVLGWRFLKCLQVEQVLQNCQICAEGSRATDTVVSVLHEPW
jgi:hypothetical protein